MKITTTFKASVLRKTEEPSSKDPNKINNYLMIMQENDAGRIFVAKEIYDSVKEGEVATFIAISNPSAEWESGRFRIVGVARPATK